MEYDASHALLHTRQTRLHWTQSQLHGFHSRWFILLTSTANMSYSIPKLSLRCDGAIKQVQHILTCGDNTKPSSTVQSRREF